jgi:uncharacterized membrane protein
MFQLGSLLYYYCLSIAPLSVVSPTVNTGKIVVNALVGRLFGGEAPLTSRKVIGLALLTGGILLQLSANQID